MRDILYEHIDYLSDRVRIERFTAAIEKLVNPDQVVLDLGCGTGILGLIALRAGARKVYFVEGSAVIEAARHTISEAGFAGHAEFFKASSFELELPERVDVAICDHVGCFGIDYGILQTLADAQERLVKPD